MSCKCKYWLDVGKPSGGHCTKMSTIVSWGTCKLCPLYEGLPRGAGDVVETLTTVTGIKKVMKKRRRPCGCAKRRRDWNKKLPIFTPKPAALKQPDQGASWLPQPALRTNRPDG